HLYGTVIEVLLPLDRIHLGAQLQQDAGLVSRPGTDFQHAVATFNMQQFGLIGYGIGLRDGLSIPYRKGNIAVSLVPEGFVEKIMPGHLANGRQHPLVSNSAPLEQLDQLFACATLTVIVNKLICHYGPKNTQISCEYRSREPIPDFIYYFRTV